MGYEERAPQPQIRQFGGLNTRDSEIGLPGNDSPSMINVDLHPVGSIRKRDGMSAQTTPAGIVGSVPVGAVMRLEQPEFSSGPRGWIYIVANSKIYRTLEPGSWSWTEPTDSASGVFTMPDQKSYGRANARFNNGTEYPSCLYICRGDGAPIVAKGLTSVTGDVETLVQYTQGTGSAGTGTRGYPSSWGTRHWPTHMRLMNSGRGSRMFAWGFEDDPNKIYYSELDVPYHYGPNDIDSASPVAAPEIDGGHFYVNRGDGGVVVSVVDMYSYKVFFKRHRIYLFTGDPADAAGKLWSPVGEISIGCVSDRAWQKVGNDILFWSEDGPRALSSVQEYGDLAQANIAFKINDSVASIAPGDYERICSYHDIENMRVVWFVPENGSSHNNAAYVYYYNEQKWAKWDGPMTEVMDALRITSTTSNPNRVVAGTFDNGMALLQSTSLDDTAEINATYTTNWINSGEISDASRVLGLDVMFGDDGPLVDVYYQTDLNSEWTKIERIERILGASGTAWGTFAWGSAAWGVTGRAMRRYEVDDLFNLIRLKFEKAGDRGFGVMGYRLEIRQKGPRS